MTIITTFLVCKRYGRGNYQILDGLIRKNVTWSFVQYRDRRDRMVVGFTTSHAISAYHHYILGQFPSGNSNRGCFWLSCIVPLIHWLQTTFKKSLNIPKGLSESVNRSTDNTMAKRKRTKRQTTIYKTYI